MELLLLFFGSFGAVIVLFLLYSGYFNPVLFKTVTLPKYSLALRPMVGDYKQSPALQAEVMQTVVDAGFDVDTTAGIYFDDPKAVDRSELRSLVGVVVKDHDVEALKKCQNGMVFLELQEQKAWYTSWAYKSGLSIMLAIMKIYPALTKRAKRDGFEIFESVEIYDFSQKTLHYYFPKQSIASVWEIAHSN